VSCTKAFIGDTYWGWRERSRKEKDVVGREKGREGEELIKRKVRES